MLFPRVHTHRKSTIGIFLDLQGQLLSFESKPDASLQKLNTHDLKLTPKASWIVQVANQPLRYAIASNAGRFVWIDLTGEKHFGIFRLPLLHL